MVQPLSANLVGDYQFNNNLSSSVGSAPDLVDLGTANSFSATTIEEQDLTVFNFAKGTGLRLSTAGVIPNNQYSVVILFKFDEISGYRRILDFLNLTQDTGFYNYSGKYDFFNVSGGDGTTTYTANQYIKTVLTRDASGQVTGYLNGKQEFTFKDSSNLAQISSANFLHFFRDNPNNENSGGSVARIMLYDNALSADEVASLDPVAGNLYQIKNPSGLVLEVAKGTVNDGSDVVAGLNKGADRQKWVIADDGIIKSNLGDFALDIVPTDDPNKQHLVIKSLDHSSPTQKWAITDTGLLHNESNGFVAVIINYGAFHFVDAIAPHIAPYYPDFNESKWEFVKV